MWRVGPGDQIAGYDVWRGRGRCNGLEPGPHDARTDFPPDPLGGLQSLVFSFVFWL